MSQERSIAVEGCSLCVEDANLAYGNAAAADDRVTEILTLPGAVGNSTNTKLVMVLDDDTVAGTPHNLLIPSSTPGAVQMRAAWLACANVASGTSSAPRVVLAGTSYEPIDTSLLGANPGGSPVYAAAYATLTRAATVTANRLTRDASDNESTSSVNLADAPAVTVLLTPAMSSRSGAFGQVPADTSTVFNFYIGTIVVAAGYAAHGQIFQNAAGGTTYLEQGSGGGSSGAVPGAAGTGVRQHRIGAAILSVASAGGTNGPTASSLNGRMSRSVEWEGQLVHAASGDVILLSNSQQNWNNRRVRITLIRAAADSGHYRAVEDVTVPGASVSLEGTSLSGSTHATFLTLTASGAGAAGGDIVFVFAALADGDLQVTITGAPKDTVDNWVVVAVASARYMR